jgi:rubrerythrin
MKTETTTPGTNRTGMATSPRLGSELIEGARETVPSAAGDEQGIATVRIQYARQGEPAGSMPPPASAKELGKTAIKALQGKNALVFVDKLGERLAFERSGTRLYEALLSKLDAYGTWEGGPSRADLEEIHGEERAHFLMLKDIIEQLGSDPTAVTPSANVHAVASQGLMMVLTDPRTNLAQGLEAILVAELVDNDCWENLSDLARTLGHEDLAGQFETALDEEREHLRRVREWLAAFLSRSAAGKRSEPFVERSSRRADASATRKVARRPPKSKPRRSVNASAGARKRAR